MKSLCLRSLIGSRGLIPEIFTTPLSLDVANRRRNSMRREAKKRSGASLLVNPFYSKSDDRFLFSVDGYSSLLHSLDDSIKPG
jgi:hypothetical protein